MVYRLKNLAEMAAAAGLEMAGIAPADPPLTCNRCCSGASMKAGQHLSKRKIRRSG